MQSKICTFCGKEFYRGKDGGSQWKTRKYCSNDCSSKAVTKYDYSEEVIAEAQRLFDSGEHITTISDKIGIPWSSLKKYLTLRDRRTFPPGSEGYQGLYVIVKIDEEDPLYSMTIQSKTKKGWMKKHRYVMAQYLGRCLYPWETVHHIDRNPSNNDITNLQLRIGSHGEGAAYHCSDCGSDRIHPVPLEGE